MKTLENKFVNLDLRELLAMYQVWKSKELAGSSEVVKSYEAELASYFGVASAITTSNGTHSLEVILRALSIGRGDEVILPAYPPVMTILPILAVGATPVFVDSQHDNLSLDIKDLASKISPKTKALICIPMWGYPQDNELAYELCRKKHVAIIEDDSHSHGSKIDNTYVGSGGCDVSYFSTQERKLIGTGEGAFILTNKQDLARNIRSIREFGKVISDPDNISPNNGAFGYNFGMNFRITTIAAGIGRVQLRKLQGKIDRRTANAQYIISRLPDYLTEISNTQHPIRPNYYSVVLQSKDELTELGEYLATHGIISDTFRFKIEPLYKLPFFKDFASKCPNTEKILKHIITLPCHEGMTKKDLDRVVSAVRSYAK